jgi:hypothetical protein
MLEKPIKFHHSTGTPEYTINDWTKRGLETSPFYWIKVDSVDGLWGSDIAYESHPIPGAIGEKSGDVFRRGKTITVTGTIWALNLSILRVGERYLQEMLWDTNMRKLRFTLWNDNFETYISCRVYQDLVISESVQDPTRHWSIGYTFALRADNPRTYKQSDNSLYPTWQT